MGEHNRTIGVNLHRVMTKNKMTAIELAAKVNVSPTHLSYVINNKRRPSLKLLDSLADALNVSVDRLTGEAASCIIEDRLREIGMTLEEVAEKTGAPLHWLKNLETFTPGQFTDNEIGYEWITKVAEAIGLPGSTLRAALARQELPLHDGEPATSTKDYFEPYTIAAHHVGNGEDWTEEELQSIEEYKEFVRAKRIQKKNK